MKIAFGCDHAGFGHKKYLISELTRLGHTMTDCGCESSQSCDYPLFAEKVASMVSAGVVERGILICGTGIGMSIVANKFRGVRAGVCWCTETAQLIAEHNAANVICLPGRFAYEEDLLLWIRRWLSTPNSTEPRHQKRIAEIREIEANNFDPKIKERKK